MKIEQKRAAILIQIERAFKAHWSKWQNKRARVPDQLRNLAVSGLELKLSIVEIAKAAGVVPKSIRNWRDAKPNKIRFQSQPKVKQLKLVSQPPIGKVAFSGEISSSSLTTAKIRLQSGVEIELPVKDLSTTLLRDLNGCAR
jgi:hypothetical protein